MTKKNVKPHPGFWLMPLAFALPFLGAAAYVVIAYGEKIQDALTIALKMVVIP